MGSFSRFVFKIIPKRQKKTNWLFTGLIAVSLGIHLLIFVHVAGIYKSEAMTYIELTVQDISKPFVRFIPQPPVKNIMPEIEHAKPNPSLRHTVLPVHIERAETALDNALVENIGLSDIPGIPGATGLSAAGWAGAGTAVSENAGAAGITQKDYCDMVRLKIESRKKYPGTARSRRIEGSVSILFGINADGRLNSAEIIRSSGHESLDNAAFNAVKNAAPFPRPPSNLFKNKPVNLEISVLFQLT
ncbi:MAG: energy transducer TonB [Desulfobacteraceae bacterium]|nr:MAG: energy transducer TonB [Desulfobacteraceae bacterium]